MPVVTRADLRKLLLEWQRGEVSHVQVYDWANERCGPDDWDSEDEIAAEVLANLDILDVNLFYRDDIPTFLSMLDAGSSDDAVRILNDHGKHFDLEARIDKLRDDPFYAPFCQRPGSGE